MTSNTERPSVRTVPAHGVQLLSLDPAALCAAAGGYGIPYRFGYANETLGGIVGCHADIACSGRSATGAERLEGSRRRRVAELEAVAAIGAIAAATIWCGYGLHYSGGTRGTEEQGRLVEVPQRLGLLPAFAVFAGIRQGGTDRIALPKMLGAGNYMEGKDLYGIHGTTAGAAFGAEVSRRAGG